MERLIITKQEKRKNFTKSAIVVLAPLVVVIALVGGFGLYSAHTMRTQRAEIRAANTAAIVHDFNYLLEVLEHNLPTLGMLERKHGVNLLELGEDIRHKIYDLEYDIYFMHFWRILGSEFLGPLGPAYPTGNLLRIDETRRQWMDVEQQRAGDSITVDFDGAFEQSPNFIVNTMGVNFGQMMQIIETDILEEGRIAYYGIHQFSERMTPYECMQTRQFFEQITDFDHLIIDLRGNSGGALWFFDQIVVRPLLGEELSAYFHNFYMGGQHNLDFMNAMGSNRPQSSTFNLDEMMAGFAAEYQHVREDLTRLQYHYVYRHTVTPLENPAGFQGQIWMLVDENTTGAAQMAAAFYSQTDFATLVGNTTGGGFAFCNAAGVSNFVVLPETGIIIRYDAVLTLDSNGRPIEYGTVPHYFNRPGMDAMETVLALIEEGWSR